MAKPNFGPNFIPQYFCGFYLDEMLYIVASYHCMQFQGKLMNQTCEKDKKKNSFRPHFGSFSPRLGSQNFFSWVITLLDVQNCCKLSLYAISKKTSEPNLRKWKEN